MMLQRILILFILFLIVHSQNIDLVTVKINHIVLKKSVNKVEVCFDNGIANIGNVPFIVKSNVSLSLNNVQQQSSFSNAYQIILQPNGGIKEKLIGQFEFHPQHLHWHLKGVAQYSIFKSTNEGYIGEMVAQADKVSFCMIDVFSLSRTNPVPSNFARCSGSQCIDITSIPNGIYYLINRANPFKLFYETNTNNNDAWVQFQLIGDSVATRNLIVMGYSDCHQIDGLCGQNAPPPNLSGSIPGGQANIVDDHSHSNPPQNNIYQNQTLFHETCMNYIANLYRSPVQTQHIVSDINVLKQIVNSPTVTSINVLKSELFGFGFNKFGQLGNGTSEARINKAISVDLSMALKGVNIKEIHCGNYFTMILTDKNKLIGFGSNFNGELGNDLLTHQLSPININLNLYGKEINKLRVGGSHVTLLLSDNNLYSFGLNDLGQFGNDDITNFKTSSIPIKMDFSELLFGQLGDNTTEISLLPVEMKGTPNLLQKIATGVYNSYLLTNDSILYSTGLGTSGSIGDNNFQNRLLPTKTDLSNLGNEIIDTIESGYHTVLLTNDGSVYGCGYNLNGELGDGTLIPRLQPTLTLISNVIDLSSGYSHTIASLKITNMCFNKNDTDPNVCSGNGKCISNDQCLCNEGYGDLNCNKTLVCNGISIKNATSLCYGNGKCNIKNECECFEGFKGPQCDQLTTCYGFSSNETYSSNETSVCSGNGKCIKDNVCKCDRGYYGTKCELKSICTDKITSYWKGNKNTNDEKHLNDFNQNLNVNFTLTDGIIDSNSFRLINTSILKNSKISLSKFSKDTMSISFWVKILRNENEKDTNELLSYSKNNLKFISISNLKNITFHLNNKKLNSNFQISKAQESNWNNFILILSKQDQMFKFYFNGFQQFNYSTSFELQREGVLKFENLNSNDILIDDVILFKKEISNFEIMSILKKEKFCCGKSSLDLTNVCSGNGYCIENELCQCKSGYSGVNCEILNQCDGITILDVFPVCSGYGNCTNFNECKCINGRSGSNCEIVNNCDGYSYFNTSACSGRGKCLFSNKCQCEQGFEGDFCEFKTKQISLSCSTTGCTANLKIKNISTFGHKISQMFISSLKFDQTDFVEADKYIEYININNIKVRGRCDPGLNGKCGYETQYTCLENFNVTNFLNQNQEFNISTKISNFVTSSACNGNLLSGNLTLRYTEKETECFGVKGSESTKVCSAGKGKCIDQDKCECYTGYSGAQCQNEIQCFGISNFDRNTVCSGQGECIAENICKCNSTNYFGEDCSLFNCQQILKNESNVCSGNGQCTSPNICSCNTEYEGIQCEIPKSTITKNFTADLSCNGIGCIASTSLNLNSNNLKFKDLKIDLFVQRIDFIGEFKFIEWISINNVKVVEKCKPNVEKNCNSYYPCLSNFNILKNVSGIVLRSSSLPVSIKVSNNITDLCSDKVNFKMNFEFEFSGTNSNLVYPSPYDFYPLFIAVVVVSLVFIILIMFFAFLIVVVIYYTISYKMQYKKESVMLKDEEVELKNQ
eukprot:gene1580-12705_t